MTNLALDTLRPVTMATSLLSPQLFIDDKGKESGIYNFVVWPTSFVWQSMFKFFCVVQNSN